MSFNDNRRFPQQSGYDRRLGDPGEHRERGGYALPVDHRSVIPSTRPIVQLSDNSRSTIASAPRPITVHDNSRSSIVQATRPALQVLDNSRRPIAQAPRPMTVHSLDNSRRPIAQAPRPALPVSDLSRSTIAPYSRSPIAQATRPALPVSDNFRSSNLAVLRPIPPLPDNLRSSISPFPRPMTVHSLDNSRSPTAQTTRPALPVSDSFRSSNFTPLRPIPPLPDNLRSSISPATRPMTVHSLDNSRSPTAQAPRPALPVSDLSRSSNFTPLRPIPPLPDNLRSSISPATRPMTVHSLDNCRSPTAQTTRPALPVSDNFRSSNFTPLRPIPPLPDNLRSSISPATRTITVHPLEHQRRSLLDRNSPMHQLPPQTEFNPVKPLQKFPHDYEQQLTNPLQNSINRSRNNSDEENITPPSSVPSSITTILSTGVPEIKFYRIKLEIPASLLQYDRQIIENNLLKTLNTTVSPLSREEYSEAGCVPYTETTYEIPCNISGANFINSMIQFLSNAPDDVTVKTCDPALLSQTLVAEHTGLSLECLRLGNIDHEGTFLSHYEVNYNDRNRSFRNEQNNWMKSRFTANFQYGHKRIFFIELWNFEPQNQLYARYFLTGEHEHIRRIMISTGNNNEIRLTFELTCPVFIKKKNKIDLRELEKYLEFEPNYRHFTIHRKNGNVGYPETLADSRFLMLEFRESLTTSMLHEVLSRLHFRTGRPVEFVGMPIADCFIGRQSSPYMSWMPNNHSVCPFGEDHHAYNEALNIMFPKRVANENGRKQFLLSYHLQALISRGAVVKDRLLLSQDVYLNFVNFVITKAVKEFDECIRLLEATILFVETRSRIKNMADVLYDLYRSMKNQELSVLQPPMVLTSGYQRVLSVVCTPTRIILKAAEIQMGNRVTRNYDSNGTEVIRVTFRDDDGKFMRENIIGEKNMQQCVLQRMIEGITIAGKKYTFFGSSGSQQRDQGAYFMIEEKVEETLNKLGDFDKIGNIHKRLAREGQCLTQSRECNVPIRRWMIESDVVGGCNRFGNFYLFTDGAGRMSEAFAKKVAESLGHPDYVPSAVQFRCGGMKGLLVIDPDLDDKRKWAEENRPEELEKYDYDVIFRDSQNKFEGEEIKYIEVVKCSMPQTTNLSRPLISLHDQITGMQSKEKQKTSGERIEDLQENVFFSFADAAVDEDKFRAVLEELPSFVNFKYLSQAKGFQLHLEPHFRRLFATKLQYETQKKLSNQSIPIPANLGRSALGVPDSSGQLQYGQVYIQITTSMNDKFPSQSSATEIIRGPVLVTKNPALADGDIRVFEAVDIPELHGQRDVIVFANYGERWNCDEMAGSDADGDEYTGIWDQSLVFTFNQPAFDFATEKETSEPNTTEKMSVQRAKACYELFTNNKIGLLSEAHLVSSDLHGINAPTTVSLTKKVTEALDFGKSGKVPEKMTTTWTEHPDTGKPIPPEKIERRPDFKGSTFQPTYASAGLNGRLYRMNKQAMNVISTDFQNEKITTNTVLAKKAWNDITDRLGVDIKNQIMDDARRDFNRYVAKMRAILDNYGVPSETQLLTDCIMEMRSKFAEREDDSGSFYTTGHTILQLTTEVNVEARKMFFEEFGGWRQVTSCEDMYHEEDVCKRVCCVTSDEINAKALAYYKVCYENPSSHQFLSFAWLAADVLANVHQHYLANHPDEIPEEESFYTKLTADVTNVAKGKKNTEFLEFAKRANHKPFILPFLGSYGKHYTGISATWFVLVEWAKMCGVLKNGLTEDHLLLIFIALGTQTISTGDQPFMEILPKTFVYDKANCESLDKGRTIVQLLRAMASRKFARLTSLNFEMLGAKMTLSKGEWIPLHEAARKSFFSLLLNQRIEELLSSPATLMVKEWEPRVIELPDDANLPLLTSKLTELTGAESILLRRMNPKFPGFVTAFIRGNQESEERFQKYTQMKAPVNGVTDKEKIDELTRLNYLKILRD